MKASILHHKILTQKQFFLLMVVPLLIGVFITLTSLAHAEWNKKDDPHLLKNPTKQGWIQVEERDFF